MKWVTLTTVSWITEAEQLCLALQAEEIDTHIPDENTAGVLPLHAGALGGIRIQVPEDDLEAARVIYQAWSGETPLSCPTCGSSNVNIKRVHWPMALLVVLLIGIPLLWLRKQYTCADCGHCWREEPAGS